MIPCNHGIMEEGRMSRFDTVVISDLHLGARNARPEDLLRFLDWVDDPRLRGLEHAHARAFEALRDFARTHRVTWICGNHDPHATWWRGVLGIEAQQELVCDFGGQGYLICHGHRWDSSLQLPAPIIAAADGIYHACQWLDPSHRLARRLKRGSKCFCRVVESLRRHAISEARERRLAGVILGHSHVASDVQSDGVHYLNSGCWTERPAGFVGVRDGQPRRYFWEAILRRSLRVASKLQAQVMPPAMLPRWQVVTAGGRA
jgi:UDP-2,3-diacylglucosamine pyrophosphatase LpxH